MNKDIIENVEENIIGCYDNDTVEMIIEYLQRRVEDIKRQLKEVE
jgi:hypothetical protein